MTKAIVKGPKFPGLKLSLVEYAPLARGTLKTLDYAGHMEHMGLGVIGEIGEFADAIKKHMIYGKDLDVVNLHEEGGDCFWYAVNYLPELKVDVAVLQAAFDTGYEIGAKAAAEAAAAPFPPSPVRAVFKAAAQIAGAALALNTDSLEPEQVRLNAVGIMGKNLGVLYGLFGLSLAESLGANINKLAIRYPDGFSTLGAASRDTAAERKSLEKDLAPAKTEEVEVDPGKTEPADLSKK